MIVVIFHLNACMKYVMAQKTNLNTRNYKRAEVQLPAGCRELGRETVDNSKDARTYNVNVIVCNYILMILSRTIIVYYAP